MPAFRPVLPAVATALSRAPAVEIPAGVQARGAYRAAAPVVNTAAVGAAAEAVAAAADKEAAGIAARRVPAAAETAGERIAAAVAPAANTAAAADSAVV